MANFKPLPTSFIDPEDVCLQKCDLPELVHLEDAATSVFHNFSKKHARFLDENDSISMAETIVERDGTHEMLIETNSGQIVGLLSSADVLGAKPITIAEKQRVSHDRVHVKAVMTPINKVPTMDASILEHAKVGNIVASMNAQKSKFILITRDNSYENCLELVGLFSMMQISHQLHHDVAKSVGFTGSVLDLKKR